MGAQIKIGEAGLVIGMDLAANGSAPQTEEQQAQQHRELFSNNNELEIVANPKMVLEKCPNDQIEEDEKYRSRENGCRLAGQNNRNNKTPRKHTQLAYLKLSPNTQIVAFWV